MVLKTPEGYGIGGNHNYYFSHMLNCIYDCRYCFLQGMYRSAHYVLFVNYEDFEIAIVSKISETNGEIIWFFSGYDCDSLALEPITGFVEHVLPLFARHPNAFIELRTKSTQVRSLLRTEPLPNCVVAFSFTPKEISAALENGVPSVEKRIDAMVRLQRRGWRLGLRFDPVIYHQDYRAHYRRLFTDLFQQLDSERLHSVTLGTFRLPAPYHRKILRLYPDEPLFATTLEPSNGMVSYTAPIRDEMIAFCEEELQRYVTLDICFSCSTL
jgi:spore photoproduct lyase